MISSSCWRMVFETGNRLTIPISATGSAGMEAAFVNLIEPGDPVVVCVNGVFGERMSDIVTRCGGKLTRVEAEWGRGLDMEEVRQALHRTRPSILAAVQAETSTGVLTPPSRLREVLEGVPGNALVAGLRHLTGRTSGGRRSTWGRFRLQRDPEMLELPSRTGSHYGFGPSRGEDSPEKKQGAELVSRPDHG